MHFGNSNQSAIVDGQSEQILCKDNFEFWQFIQPLFMGQVNILFKDNSNHPGSPASPRLPSSQLCSVQGELCINLQQNPKHALQLSHLCEPRFGRWRTATGTGCLTRRSSALPCEFLLFSLLLQQLHLQRYLIEYKLAGNDLPCILPPHLKPPSQR